MLLERAGGGTRPGRRLFDDPPLLRSLLAVASEALQPAHVVLPLIRALIETPHHLLPVALEDIKTSTTRFLAEPTIRLRPDDNAASEQLGASE